MRECKHQKIFINISGCTIQIEEHSAKITRTTVKEMDQYADE